MMTGIIQKVRMIPGKLKSPEMTTWSVQLKYYICLPGIFCQDKTI
jgi:hypothetical protein